MKLGYIIFSIFLFTALFGAPVVQTFLDDDKRMVYQESEESDSEEVEDVNPNDVIENLYFNKEGTNHVPLILEITSLVCNRSLGLRTSQYTGVDTPPPEYS